MAKASKAGQVLAAAISSIVISTVAIALRIWSRVVIRKNRFWWDDHFAVAAWAFAVANSAMAIYLVQIGFGQHIHEIANRTASIDKMAVVLFVDVFLYNGGITTVKLSALCFYARIFQVVKSFRFAQWITISLVVGWYITWTVASVAGCSPVEANWKVGVQGHCLDPNTTRIATATTNVVIDFLILVLPLPMIWHLRMSGAQRLAFAIVFLLGYSVMVVSILRTVSTVRLAKGDSSDFPWSDVQVEILYILEVPIGVVSICLPTILLLGKTAYMEGWVSLVSKNRSKASVDSAPRMTPHVGETNRTRTSITGKVTGAHGEFEPLGTHDSGQIEVATDVEVHSSKGNSEKSIDYHEHKGY